MLHKFKNKLWFVQLHRSMKTTRLHSIRRSFSGQDIHVNCLELFSISKACDHLKIQHTFKKDLWTYRFVKNAILLRCYLSTKVQTIDERCLQKLLSSSSSWIATFNRCSRPVRNLFSVFSFDEFHFLYRLYTYKSRPPGEH